MMMKLLKNTSCFFLLFLILAIQTANAIANLNTATVPCHRSTTPPTTPATEIPRLANKTTTDFDEVPSNHNATTSTISVTPMTSSPTPTPTPFPMLAKIVIPAAIVAIILIIAGIGFWNKDEIRRYVIKHPENEPVPA